MRPAITLDGAVMRENALAWREHAGVPVRAVIKSEGYGWGFEALVHALEEVVDAFIVADVEEFDAVRPLTRRPVVTLGDVPPGQVGRLLDAGAIPNLVSAAGVQAAIAWARARGRRARVRIGLRPAMGWAGFTLEEFLANVFSFASPELEIELWTHLTHPDYIVEQRAAFVEAQTALRRAGGRIAATDSESTLPLASREASAETFVRLGVGLFGARYGGGPAGVRCALRVEAPVVQRVASRGQPVGYGAVRAPDEGYVLVARCGYGDGFTRMTGTTAGILAVGMQYTVLWRRNWSDARGVVLADADTDLDDLARAAGVAPHEIVVRLGNANRRSATALLRK
jgi:alanine racemase